MISTSKLKKISIAILALLLVPFVAMKFTNQVNWTLLDFVAMAILLFTTALTIEFVWRKTNNQRFIILFCAMVLLIMLLIWAELAVGIF